MAMYEVVLKWDDTDEVRLTDQPLKVGTTVTMQGAEWEVERVGKSRSPGVTRRYVLRRLTKQS